MWCRIRQGVDIVNFTKSSKTSEIFPRSDLHERLYFYFFWLTLRIAHTSAWSSFYISCLMNWTFGFIFRFLFCALASELRLKGPKKRHNLSYSLVFLIPLPIADFSIHWTWKYPVKIPPKNGHLSSLYLFWPSILILCTKTYNKKKLYARNHVFFIYQ